MLKGPSGQITAERFESGTPLERPTVDQL
jgi:hypothetical protein